MPEDEGNKVKGTPANRHEIDAAREKNKASTFIRLDKNTPTSQDSPEPGPEEAALNAQRFSKSDLPLPSNFPSGRQGNTLDDLRVTKDDPRLTTDSPPLPVAQNYDLHKGPPKNTQDKVQSDTPSNIQKDNSSKSDLILDIEEH